MAFGATYESDELLVLGDNALVMGTAMLGDAFGQVTSCTLKRAADKAEIEAAGGSIRACVLSKLRLELVIEVVFDNTVEPPGLLELITFPIVELNGQILDCEAKWERGKERMLSINATLWDALSEAPCFTYDPVTGTYVEINVVEEPLSLNDGDDLLLNDGNLILNGA